MTYLCDKCGREPWVAPVFVGLKPTEQWCDNCIQIEINTGSAIEVLGDYLEIKKQKEIIYLLDKYIESDYKRVGLDGWPCPALTRIRELLVELWGDQE